MQLSEASGQNLLTICLTFMPQDPHTNFPDWSTYVFFMTSLENLIKDHSIFPLMINLLILITFSFGHMLMLFGEDLCRSLCRWSPKSDRRKSSPNNSNIVLGITNDLLYPSLRIKMNFFLLIIKMINIYWFLIKSDYGRKGLTELYVCFGCKNNVQISYNMQEQIIELNSALANSV